MSLLSICISLCIPIFNTNFLIFNIRVIYLLCIIPLQVNSQCLNTTYHQTQKSAQETSAKSMYLSGDKLIWFGALATWIKIQAKSSGLQSCRHFYRNIIACRGKLSARPKSHKNIYFRNSINNTSQIEIKNHL